MERPEPNERAESMSVRVVEAIATATDTDPFDMEPPLYDAINPEALDRLFRPGVDCSVAFEYEGHDVEVRSDGTVSVDGTPHDDR